MALRHHAWTFDPGAFHSWLENEVIAGDEFSPERLRSLAISIAESDDPAVDHYLRRCLCLSRDDYESWEGVFSEVDDSYHVHEWYVVAMAAHVTPCPGLDLSWLALEKLLGLTGVGPQWIVSLTRGASLASLVNWYGHEWFHRPVGRYLGVEYGGWLASPTVEQRLRNWEDRRELPAWVPPDEAASLETALDVARAMLSAARHRGAALRTVIS